MLLNVDFSTPTAKRVIVALASVSSAIFCALFFEVKKRIEKRGGNDTVRVVKEGKPTMMTVVDHDLEALYELFTMGMLVRRFAPCLLCLSQASRQAYFVATFARVYMGVSPPLLLQALTQPLNIWEHQVRTPHVTSATIELFCTRFSRSTCWQRTTACPRTSGPGRLSAPWHSGTRCGPPLACDLPL